MECGGEHDRGAFDSRGVAWQAEFKRCTPWLLEALKYNGGTHSLYDVFKGISEGRYQFWPCKTCVMVSEILAFPQKWVFNYFLAGGDDATEMKAGHADAEAWAKAHGCKSVTLTGRRGWERTQWLKDAGYKTVQITLEKEL